MSFIRSILDAGRAQAVMDNHGFNAIRFATPPRDGSVKYLLKRSPKSIALHADLLRQIGDGSPLN